MTTTTTTESGLLDFLIQNDSNGHRFVICDGTEATITTTPKRESDDKMDQKELVMYPIMTRIRCCISSQQTPAFEETRQ